MRSHHRIYLQNIVVSFIGQYRLFYRALLQKRPMMMMMMIDHHHLMMMYSQSHLGWHFRMLIQSSKLKARMFLFTETWQKRRSSPELWTFENVTPSGIGCIIILMKMMMIDHHHLLCDHDDMSSSNILMMMYHHLDDDVSSIILMMMIDHHHLLCDLIDLLHVSTTNTLSHLPIHCLTYQYTRSAACLNYQYTDRSAARLSCHETDLYRSLVYRSAACLSCTWDRSHVMRPICLNLLHVSTWARLSCHETDLYRFLVYRSAACLSCQYTTCLKETCRSAACLSCQYTTCLNYQYTADRSIEDTSSCFCVCVSI